jgi:hypothetical protein
MKKMLFCCFVLIAAISKAQIDTGAVTSPPPRNLVIITVDGFRWQEVFNGADSELIRNIKYTPDTALQTLFYWDTSAELRRKKLLPCFWSLINRQGIIMGNRGFGNDVQVANPYRLSYAGYNEMFTGQADWRIFSNKRKRYGNANVFEQLSRLPAYEGRIAIFSSWDVFPYILKKEKNEFYLNSGYENMTDSSLQWVNAVQQQAIAGKEPTRKDWLTYIVAREYMQQHQPRITYIALGETDEWAHRKRYDLYLQQANAFDKMLADLWNYIQSTPFYRNNTTVIITTDHGRGNKPGNWFKHGILVPGSGQTWLAVIGAGIVNTGEQKMTGHFTQNKLPVLINRVLGVELPAHSLSQNNSYAADSR